MTIAAPKITLQAFLQAIGCKRSVLVYQPDRLPDLLLGADQLPVLDDIALPLSVDRIDGWLRRTG